MDRQHLKFLDGIRAACALVVVAAHAWLEVWPVGLGRQPTGVTAALTGWLLYARFAVDVFIMVSGYCLMLPVAGTDGTLRGGALRFYLRRARRILPPFYAALAFSVVLIVVLVGKPTGTHWDNSLPLTGAGIAANLLLLQDFLYRGNINHTFWSIAVEWKIYFLFPLLVLAFARFGPRLTTIGVVMASSAIAVAVRHQTQLADLTIQYIGLFALGALAAQISLSGKLPAMEKRLLAIASTISAIAIVVLCRRWSFVQATNRFVVLDPLAAVAVLPVLIHCGTCRQSLVTRTLEFTPLVWIGTFSYSLYLIHAPLLQIVWQYYVHPMRLGDAATFAAMLLIGMPFCIGVAFLFFLVAERPFLSGRAKRRVREETELFAVPA
ncbi:MAG TPA: acyltransferase [Tepidisphaeraceae bacterium]|jgi:peptidoglycan/LPS O-acetylase OafA/YrhL|nr:acyltransferase [Tepidisphaeraceae bacterium]